MNLIARLEARYKKPAVTAVRSGDTVKVTQRIQESNKERLQVFEGLVIRVDRKQSLTCRLTVRKLVGSIGVEKSFLIHSSNVVQVEVVKRAKVRRNYLSYMRSRIGKAARLKNVPFDKKQVNQPAQTATKEASKPVKPAGATTPETADDKAVSAAEAEATAEQAAGETTAEAKVSQESPAEASQPTEKVADQAEATNQAQAAADEPAATTDKT